MSSCRCLATSAVTPAWRWESARCPTMSRSRLKASSRSSDVPLDTSNVALDVSNGPLEVSNVALDGSNEALAVSNAALDGSNVPLDGSNEALEEASDLGFP